MGLSVDHDMAGVSSMGDSTVLVSLIVVAALIVDGSCSCGGGTVIITLGICLVFHHPPSRDHPSPEHHSERAPYLPPCGWVRPCGGIWRRAPY